MFAFLVDSKVDASIIYKRMDYNRKDSIVKVMYSNFIKTDRFLYLLLIILYFSNLYIWNNLHAYCIKIRNTITQPSIDQLESRSALNASRIISGFIEGQKVHGGSMGRANRISTSPKQGGMGKQGERNGSRDTGWYERGTNNFLYRFASIRPAWNRKDCRPGNHG